MNIFWFCFQHLFDKRDVNDTDAMYNAICKHIDYSYHNGAIRPTITIFRKRQGGRSDLRVWNSLMLGFAGYSVESTKDGQLPEDENEIEEEGHKTGRLGRIFFSSYILTSGCCSNGAKKTGAEQKRARTQHVSSPILLLPSRPAFSFNSTLLSLMARCAQGEG